MLKKLLFIRYIIIVLLVDCQGNTSEFSPVEIPVKPEAAQKAGIDEVFKQYKTVNISMPDSVFFGNIEVIKTDDHRIYLFDPSQTKTITILDKQGHYINQLKRVGSGPGEYTTPFAFAIDRENDELILYDRAKLEFITYRLPSLEFVETRKQDAFLMNFEVIDNDYMLAVRDGTKSKNRYYGLEIWDSGYEVVKDEISDMRSAVIELSYASTIGRDETGLLYAHPFTGVISRITSVGLTPAFKLSFGEWEISEELYSMDEARHFEQALTQNTYAFWPRFPIQLNNKIMVWYMYGADINSYQLLVQDIVKNTQNIYTEIMIGESLKLPMPLGIDDDRYISLVWPENIDSENIPDEYRELFEQSLNTELPIIFYLK